MTFKSECIKKWKVKLASQIFIEKMDKVFDIFKSFKASNLIKVLLGQNIKFLNDMYVFFINLVVLDNNEK